MADEIRPTIPANIYERESRYMQAMGRHSQDFDRLVASVPEDKPHIIKTMRELYHVEPDKLLNPEKLAKLKRENEPLFREVSVYYGDFLKEMVGLK